MDTQRLLESLNADIIRKTLPVMDVGDTVNIHCKIVEGDKERIQVFSGVLISRSGSGINEMIVVRRVVEGTGVERIFPLNSPRVAEIEVSRRGDARRAKLYYLRERSGKSQRLRDRRRAMKRVAGIKLAGQH